jgi:hypothetical protein
MYPSIFCVTASQFLSSIRLPSSFRVVFTEHLLTVLSLILHKVRLIWSLHVQLTQYRPTDGTINLVRSFQLPYWSMNFPPLRESEGPPLNLSQLNQKTSMKFDVIYTVLIVQFDMASSLFSIIKCSDRQRLQTFTWFTDTDTRIRKLPSSWASVLVTTAKNVGRMLHMKNIRLVRRNSSK